MAAALCLMLALCSCGLIGDVIGTVVGTDSTDDGKPLFDTVEYTDLAPLTVQYHPAYTPLISDYSYRALPDDAQRLLYDRLLDSVYSINPERDDTTGLYQLPQAMIKGRALGEAKVRTVIKAIYDDHPEIFWLAGTIGHLSGDDATIVQLYSNYSPDEVGERLEKVQDVISAFYAGLPAGLSVYEREKLCHDYLIDHIVYCEEVDVDDSTANDPDIYTVYGALEDGVAVCEGYARSFQLLLNGLGIECVGITGASEGQLHLWNAVRINGSWCGVDTTWDDHEELYKRYAYFNLTDEDINRNHTPAPLFSELSDDQINGTEESDYSAMSMNIFVPVCDTDEYGYYLLECPHLSDYGAAALKEGLMSAALAGDGMFVFYIEPSFDFDDAVTVLFKEQPQYFFSYIEEVNRSLYDYSIDHSNISYYAVACNRIVAVELNYY